MLNEIITAYAIIDDLLKAIGHEEDCRRVMSDAEIITTVVCAAMFFGGNQSQACGYMKEHNLIPDMLEKSRFNRRLHGIARFILTRPTQTIGRRMTWNIQVKFT